jgi:hypothetical protein
VNFRALPPQLQKVAERVALFFKEERGLSRLKVEEAVVGEIDYRPTFQTITPEFHDVWIEVSEQPYLSSLDTVVLHCATNNLPVKLYVAFPAGEVTIDYKTRIDHARRTGVGVIEVTDGACQVIHEAIPLFMIGVRKEDHKKFPLRYRGVLSASEATFRGGDPAKACSLVYDEIEGLSRRIAKKIHAKGLWKATPAGPPKTNFDKDAWEIIIDLLMNRVQHGALPSEITKALLMRVAAVIGGRNAAGHKPKNRKDRMKRDTETRTRYETAVDLLRDFVDAARPLRV